MANVVVTIRIMPDSPDVDLEAVRQKAKEEIKAFAGEGEIKMGEQPVAFGIKATNIIFVMDENLGATDLLEDKIKEIDGVSSVEVTDVRRAIG